MIELLPDTPSLSRQLYPFTSVRQCKDLRLGILTISRKWELLLEEFLSRQYSNRKEKEQERELLRASLLSGLRSIPGNWVPSNTILEAINAGRVPQPDKVLLHPWQIFEWNDDMIRMDFRQITRGRSSFPIPESVLVDHPSEIFIEEGVRLSHCTLNASTGPIYISRNCEIMEGARIRGPFFLGEGSVVKMGACIYGATSIGPSCIIGGEVKNSVLLGFSNKAHEGYLGDSVIGEWCNLGAGTCVSNLRNTAGTVRVWSSADEKFQEAGPKCGLLMGDYSRSAILTAFNTGTVVGVCAHVFGIGLTPKYIRDFSWGSDGILRYEWDKVMRDINNWKKLKGKQLTEEEIQVLRPIFDGSTL